MLRFLSVATVFGKLHLILIFDHLGLTLARNEPSGFVINTE